MTVLQIKEPPFPFSAANFVIACFKSDLVRFCSGFGLHGSCSAYVHHVYVLLLSMLDSGRMHHAVTWWLISTQRQLPAGSHPAWGQPQGMEPFCP